MRIRIWNLDFSVFDGCLPWQKSVWQMSCLTEVCLTEVLPGRIVFLWGFCLTEVCLMVVLPDLSVLDRSLAWQKNVCLVFCLTEVHLTEVSPWQMCVWLRFYMTKCVWQTSYLTEVCLTMVFAWQNCFVWDNTVWLFLCLTEVLLTYWVCFKLWNYIIRQVWK